MIDRFLNRIICGDAVETMESLPDECIDAVITDPPYGVNKADWDIINYDKWFNGLQRVMKNNSSIYIFGAIYNYDKLLVSAKKYFKHLNTLIWLFPNGMNRLINNWQICYDPIFFGSKGQHKFNTDDIRYPYTKGTQIRIKSPVIKGGKEWKPNPKGRKPENVIVIPCLNHGAGQGERVNHPTQKPVKLIERLTLASSNENDLILDPFVGSGTTAVACKKLKRNYIGIEIDPEYCKIAEARIKAVQPILL